MGSSQAVRQAPLKRPFAGSIPASPAYNMNINQLFAKELTDFEERISQYLEELQITEKVQPFFVDHLGLRLKNTNDILVLKNELLEKGQIISSAIINGRKILIYKLDTPIQIQNWHVPCIELPYPKPDHSYPDGWEHIEIVIPSSAVTLEEFKDSFKSYFSEIDIESLKQKGQYSEDEPRSESDQLPNPTIALRKNKNTAIKFHARTIEQIVSN